MASPSASPSLPLSATVAPVPIRGTGFNSLPPLPIISTIFEFLKSLDLRTVGMKLGDVPPEFGWVLLLFDPNLEPTVSEGVLEPSKGQTVSKGVLEPSVAQTVSDGVLEVDTTQSGSEPGSEPGEARTGPVPVFLDRLDDPFINLDRVEDLEETNSDGSDSTIVGSPTLALLEN